MNRAATGGFTLIELLIGITMLGVLLGVAVPSYLRYLARLETAQVAGAYQQRLEAARGLARRGQEVRVKTTTGSDVTTVETYDAGTLLSTKTYPLGNAKASADTTVILYPPYATLNAAPVTVTFASSRNATITRPVRIISVMGKSVTP